ncbi:MAG: hypothetical protein HY815_02950 [Candidatus Riflebacteria bacterium]|nr:hypothetical protein [Candidatus Riflebacteria bacterium]
MHEAVLESPDTQPGVRHKVNLTLPFKDEGAYLVVLRGEEASTSGLVLISRLSMTVGEDAGSGRVRVQVQREPEAKPIFGSSVRVVGSASSGISSGKTDPRGIYVADGVSGQSTVIARMGESYAFYRGTVALAPARPPPAPAPMEAAAESYGQQGDLKGQVLSGLKNRARSLGQGRIVDLQQRVFRNVVKGVEVQQMAQ